MYTHTHSLSLTLFLSLSLSLTLSHTYILHTHAPQYTNIKIFEEDPALWSEPTVQGLG